MKKYIILNWRVFMGLALRKDGRLSIPTRNQSQIAKPKPCLGIKHDEQVCSAVAVGMIRYERAMDKLSKV